MKQNSVVYTGDEMESLIKDCLDEIISYAIEVKKTNKGVFDDGILFGLDVALTTFKLAIEPYDKDLLKRLGLDFDITEKIRK